MSESVKKHCEYRTAHDESRHRGERPVLVHYAITRREGNGPELLRVTLRTGEEVLPVFYSRRAAQNFLASVAFGRDWYASECHAGELTSLLLSLYADIEWVLLDPLPGCLASGGRPANLMLWRNFVDYLLDSRWERSDPVGGP